MGAAPDLVMNCIAQIKAPNTQLRINIMGDTSDQVIQLLEQGRIDLAISRRNAGVSFQSAPTSPLHQAHVGTVRNPRRPIELTSKHSHEDFLHRVRGLNVFEPIGDAPDLIFAIGIFGTLSAMRRLSMLNRCSSSHYLTLPNLSIY